MAKKKPKPKRGRPEMPAAERHVRVTITLPPDLHECVQEVADKNFSGKFSTAAAAAIYESPYWRMWERRK